MSVSYSRLYSLSSSRFNRFYPICTDHLLVYSVSVSIFVVTYRLLYLMPIGVPLLLFSARILVCLGTPVNRTTEGSGGRSSVTKPVQGLRSSLP